MPKDIPYYVVISNSAFAQSKVDKANFPHLALTMTGVALLVPAYL